MLKKQSMKEKIMLTLAVVLTVISAVSSVSALFEKGINFVNVLSVIDCVLVIIYSAVAYKKPHGNLMKYLMLIFAMTYGSIIAIGEAQNAVLAVLRIAAVIAIAFISGRLNRYKQNIIISLAVLVALSGVAAVDVIAMSQRDSAGFIPDGTVIISAAGDIVVPEKPDGDADSLAIPDGEVSPTEIPGGEEPAFGRQLPHSVRTIIELFQFYNMPILWFAIVCGYISRFNQHKEAGLVDKGEVAAE